LTTLAHMKRVLYVTACEISCALMEIFQCTHCQFCYVMIWVFSYFFMQTTVDLYIYLVVPRNFVLARKWFIAMEFVLRVRQMLMVLRACSRAAPRFWKWGVHPASEASRQFFLYPPLFGIWGYDWKLQNEKTITRNILKTSCIMIHKLRSPRRDIARIKNYLVRTRWFLVRTR